MKITIKREDFLNNIKLVEKICSQKGVLSNILIETIADNRVRFSATDLNLAITSSCDAQIDEAGSVTLASKKLSEIVLKLPEKPVELDLNPETNVVTIKCSNSKFEIVGLSAEEFPKNIEEVDTQNPEAVKIELKPFIKAIKQTVFASAGHESNSVLSGVNCTINDGIVEMAATDGNRLARIKEEIAKDFKGEKTFIIPSKTLIEVQRIASIVSDEDISILILKNKIIFITKDVILSSGLLEGTYPKYQQLIPDSSEKIAVINRENLMKAIERASIMVNERTNIVKFTFTKDKLELKTDTPDTGMCEDFIDVEFDIEDELVIAFNYRFVLEALNVIDTSNVNVGLSGSLSATLFRPQGDQDYLCLVMPVQVR